jgi:hypothetical protein
VFLHPVGSVGHVVHSSTSRLWNIDTLFFMLRWAWCCFHKKRRGTRYTKLVFLHLVGSVGDVVNSGASGPWNVDTLFFMLGWARCTFHKKHARTRYAGLVLLHLVGSTGHIIPNMCFCILLDLWVTLCILVRPSLETPTHYFSCSGGNGTDFTKGALGYVTPNLCSCIRWDLWVM